GLYVLTCLTSESDHGGWLAAVVVGAALATLLHRTDPVRERLTRHLLGVSLLATAVLFYYAGFGVDSLTATYTGLFCGAIRLVLVTLGAMHAAVLAAPRVWTSRALALGVTAVMGWALFNGRFTNAYPGSPEIPQLCDAVIAARGGPDVPIAVAFER